MGQQDSFYRKEFNTENSEGAENTEKKKKPDRLSLSHKHGYPAVPSFSG